MSPLLIASFFLLALPLRASENEPYNVVLIGFDTLRADHTGFGGYSRPVTPNLDRLSGKSCVFTQAVTQAPWTLPSFMSIFTSLYPHDHRMVNKFASFASEHMELSKLSSSIVTLAQVFKENGFATAAFTGGAGVKGDFGFKNGFDLYSDSRTFGGFRDTVPQAAAWLRKPRAAPFFLFLHGYEAHGQYPVSPDFKSRFADPRYLGRFKGTPEESRALRIQTVKNEPIVVSTADVRFLMDRYDERILRGDEQLGRFLETLRELKLDGRTVIVALSDHGEQFDEHGGFDHGTNLYEELIHVPLLIHVPSQAPSRVDSQVRLIDVMPTLIDLLHLRISQGARRQMEGVSLKPLMDGKPLDIDAFSETDFLLHVFKRSLRTNPGWKLIYDINMDGEDRDELYDLKKDPREKYDLVKRSPGASGSLKEKLLHLMTPEAETAR